MENGEQSDLFADVSIWSSFSFNNLRKKAIEGQW
jgi:hypothetical protein